MKYIRIFSFLLSLLFITTFANAQIAITESGTIDISNDSLLLKVNDFRGNIQWQHSADSLNWTDIQDANEPTLLLKNTDLSGLYRAKIVDGFCSPFYSDTVMLVSSNSITVKSLLVKSVTSNSVEYEASVSTEVESQIVSVGVVWDTIPNPTIEMNKGSISNGKINGNYSGEVTALDEFKTYYLRAYAISSTGTFYGKDLVFTTLNSALECESDCCNKMYSHVAIQHLDTVNARHKLLYNLLYEVDREHAFNIFVRNPVDFMTWCNLLNVFEELKPSYLASVVHEANHMTNSKLRMCSSNYKKTFLFCGNIFTVEVNSQNTEHISIVEETIAEKLKVADRYKTYIEDHKDGDNSFDSLLEELNSYTGGAHFTYLYLKSGKAPSINGTSTSDGNLNGMLNFMVWLQYYLKTARLNYSNTYNTIKSPQNLAYIQVIWEKAETQLEQNYEYTTISGNDNMYQHEIDLEYFKAAYSEDLLNELDLIGINHKNQNHWETTYLK